MRSKKFNAIYSVQEFSDTLQQSIQSLDFFLPVTLGTSSPERRKSGYDKLPPEVGPLDMRQFAPSTVSTSAVVHLQPEYIGTYPLAPDQ